jgi:hypothetical protein
VAAAEEEELRAAVVALVEEDAARILAVAPRAPGFLVVGFE